MVRKTIAAAMFALTLIVAAYAVYRSSVYQKCTAEKAEQASQQQQNERRASFMVYVDCLGPFAHENHGPIVAVFTIILAFSTIALWVSTRDAALAAKAAAEHIPTVERAFIHGGVHPKGRALVCDGKKIRVRFSMANYGKTSRVHQIRQSRKCSIQWTERCSKLLEGRSGFGFVFSVDDDG
jgi:hypothetical protein